MKDTAVRDPVVTQLESTGKFVSVVDTRTERGMQEVYGGDYHASVIYIQDEFIKKNPNTVQAVVNAMVRANRWISKATPQQIVDLMPDEYKAGNPSLYKAGLLKNMVGYSEDGQMTLKAAQNVYKVLAQFEPVLDACVSMLSDIQPQSATLTEERIAHVRSGNPLTVFVASNRSRSQWAPSLGPGIGLGHRLAHSTASSIDRTCQIQKPATSSFVSAKGPSVTVRFAPSK